MDANQLLRQLGDPGSYAKLTFFFVCLNYFPVALNHLAMSVLGATPPHGCALPDGVTRNNESVPTLASGALDSCRVYVNFTAASGETEPCPRGWEYSPFLSDFPGGMDEDTIVMEWDLVCEDRWMASAATSIYFAGVMIGGVIFGAVSDTFGRYPVVVFTLFVPVILGIMLFFVESFILFVFIRCLIGICMQGLQLSTYVLGMEHIPNDKHRAYATGLFEMSWSLGVMTLALLAWTLKAWRYVALAFSLCSVLSLLYIWAMPESLRWLYNKREFDRCQKYLVRAEKFNKVQLDPRLTSDLASVAPPIQKHRKYTILDMFRTPVLRKRSFIIQYVWFATSCCYYGLSLNASRLSGNKYLSYFINGAIEFPAYAAGIWILAWFGRRIPLAVYFLIGGVSLIIAVVVPETTANGTSIAWVSTLLAWIGKFSTAGCWSVVFLYSSELFPTPIRNVAVGACAFWARVGSLVAPQILLLGQETKSWVPFVIFAIIGIIGGLSAFALPETKDREVPDTISEAEELGSGGERGPQEDLKGEMTQIEKNGHMGGQENEAYVSDKNVDVTIF